MNIIILKAFFMWCTIINAVILIGSAAVFMFAADAIYPIHSRFFNIPRETFKTVFYSFIAIYKVLWMVFNLVPWLALLIIG